MSKEVPVHGPNAFTRLAMDRLGEVRADADHVAALERDTCARFLWLDETLHMAVDKRADGLQPHWIDLDVRQREFPDIDASLLGVAGGVPYFLLVAPREHGGETPPTWMELRESGLQLDAFAAGLHAYARGLAYWQQTTRFCQRCGSPGRLIQAGHALACNNPDCGGIQFPRTDAAIIVVVEHDGACLLGRKAEWAPHRYSTLAGFVEPGETPEQAVHREVWEEAGVHVTGCRYHSSQPWPMPASLMLGYTAQAAARAITLRDGELQDARWFTPDDIVRDVRCGELVLSSPVSVSWHLIADWVMWRSGFDLRSLA